MDTSRNSYQRLWCGSLYDTGDKSEIGEIIHFVGTQRTASNLAQYKKILHISTQPTMYQLK